MSEWMAERAMLMWITGIVLLSSGSALFHLLTKLAGAVVGAFFGVLVGIVFALVLEPGNDRVLWVVCGIFVIGGILIGHYALRLSLSMTFAVAGILTGILLGRLGCEMFGEHPFVWNPRNAVIVSGCGLAGGIFCFHFQRMVMVLVTSAIGTFLVVRGLPFLRSHWLESSSLIFLSAVLWQGILCRRVFALPKKDEDDDEED